MSSILLRLLYGKVSSPSTNKVGMLGIPGPLKVNGKCGRGIENKGKKRD